MDKVRVALVGCGAIANGLHLPGLKALEEMGKVELMAVCDIVEAAAREKAERFGVPAIYTDLDRMLEEVTFDLLVDTTRIPDHFAVNLAALRAGRHVYTEKPLTTSVEEADQLIEEARKRRLLLASAPDHPVHPLIRAAHDLVAEGVIGRPNFAKVVSSHWGPEKQNVAGRDSSWYYRSGSSPLLDMGVHGLSEITAILGPVRRLTSFSGRTSETRTFTAGPFVGRTIDVEIEDNTLLMLDFGASSYCFLDATYCLGATRAPRLEIYGSEGVLSATGATRTYKLELYELKTREWREIELPPPDLVRALGIQHTVDCLLTGRDLVIGAERGRHLVEIMARAVESARCGRAVELATTF